MVFVGQLPFITLRIDRMLVSIESPTCLKVRVDRLAYGAEGIYKCFYWYAGRYGVDIVDEGEVWVVTLLAKEPISDMDELTRAVKRDLIDFKTRSIITKETHYIREMLIAKAF